MPYEFHSGELELQARAGVREIANRVAESIHPFIPEVAGVFLEERRFVVLAAADAENRPWACLLTGPAGFARRLDDHTIRINAAPAPDDPMAMNLRTGSPAGIVAPDLAARRRIRINGRLEAVDGGILIHVEQAYSNCPKYIQLRAPVREVTAARPRLVGRWSSLLPRHRDWVHRVDTFFIATLVPGEGADASHRGGMPGFVKVANQQLIWPDYRGNSMFNTLGNIVKHPRAGILIPDFATGTTLQLTGRASVHWNAGRSAAATEDRWVEFTPEDVIEIDDVLPQRLRLLEYSPSNPGATV